MNKLIYAVFSAIILLLSTYLSGCGGGGNSVAGIDGSGSPVTSTSGTVNGFGSVIVNGVRYHSDKAKIVVNGQISDENNLHTGYQVRVTGTLNSDGTGNATAIEFNPNLIGPITQIDLQNEQLVLLEQTVQITNATLFDSAISPNDLTGLALGTTILVSGQFNSDGLIAATRIELATQSDHQLSGVISNLVNSTFTLNNLTVNFSAATINNAPDNHLKNDLNVSIIGNLDSNNIFQAKIINVQATSFASDVKSADVEGFVTRFVSSTDFDVAGIKCTANSTTIYENGTSTTLALGSSLKLNGTVNSAGILAAQKITFRQQVINEITGTVTTVSAPVNGAIATGTFIISGTTIQTTNSTAYEDGSNDKLKRFNFTNIQAGNFLKVSGYINQSVFIATKIERGIFENNMPLRYDGVVTQVATNSFVVYGQTIMIDSDTLIFGAMGSVLTKEQFLSQALNQQIRVQGVTKNGVFTATQLEIRPQNIDDFHQPQDGGGMPQNGGGSGPH